MVPASILPTWDSNSGSLARPMPYESRFWAEPQAALEHRLAEVRGFISALPIRWTEGENIRIPYPTSLIVRTDPRLRDHSDESHQVEMAFQSSNSKPVDRQPT